MPMLFFARCAVVTLAAFALALGGSLRASQAKPKSHAKYQQVAIHPGTFGEVGITDDEIDDLFGDELRAQGFTISEDEKAAGTLTLRISFHVDDDDDDNDGIPDAKDKDDDGDGIADAQEHAEVIDLDTELGVEETLSAGEMKKPHQKLLISISCPEFSLTATSDYLDVLEDFEEDDDATATGNQAKFVQAAFRAFVTQQKPPPYKKAAHALSQVQPGGKKSAGDSLVAAGVARR